jgi:hypothetical protein
MSGPSGVAQTVSFAVSNSGAAGSLLDVAQVSLTGGYTLSGGLPITGLGTADPAAAVTLGCTQGTSPLTGTLVIQSNETGAPTYSYSLYCTLLLPVTVPRPPRRVGRSTWIVTFGHGAGYHPLPCREVAAWTCMSADPLFGGPDMPNSAWSARSCPSRSPMAARRSQSSSACAPGASASGRRPLQFTTDDPANPRSITR